jgi:GxxExxY protein
MKSDPESYAVIGAAMEVHRELGHGFSEPLYQAALALEFQARSIPFRAEQPLPIRYKGKLLTCSYRADFICFNDLVLETKAISKLTGVDQAQSLNQLKATGLHRGLLVNFGISRLEYQRLVFGAAPVLLEDSLDVGFDRGADLMA